MKRRRRTTHERGASEVISVLFMVSVTIVLAAMVGSLLLDVVGDVDENPLAGASVDFDGEADEVTVVYTVTQENGTTLDVKIIDENTDSEVCSKSIPEVGDSATFTSGGPCNLTSGTHYVVRIVATAPDGKQAVVQTSDGSI